MSVQTAPAARASAVDPWLVGLPSEARDARLYRRMRFIRRFEETLLELFEEGLLNGTTHACIGQEADAVAVIEHLRDGDHVFSNHRCHGHFLARTGDALGLLTEIMGKPERRLRRHRRQPAPVRPGLQVQRHPGRDRARPRPASRSRMQLDGAPTRSASSSSATARSARAPSTRR